MRLLTRSHRGHRRSERRGGQRNPDHPARAHRAIYPVDSVHLVGLGDLTGDRIEEAPHGPVTGPASTVPLRNGFNPNGYRRRRRRSKLPRGRLRSVKKLISILVASVALILPAAANAFYQYFPHLGAHMWWTERPNTIFMNKTGNYKLVQSAYNSSDVRNVPPGGVSPFTSGGGSGVVMYSPWEAGVEVWFCTAQLDCRKATNP